MKLPIGTKVCLKPRCCLLSDDDLYGVNEQQFLTFYGQKTFIYEIDNSNEDDEFSNLHIEDTHSHLWFRNSAIDLNMKALW